MTDKKYAFFEVGGENCQFRSRDVLIQSVKYFCRVDYEDCDIEHCKNCPHGKTLDEWAQKLEDNKDFQAIIDDKDVSYAEIAEVMIKALLGGEDK